ncbi:hypothetical protein SprV_0100500900 [Sparganum proliferum]
MKRALKARLETSQSPPLRLYFRSLESDQDEALETSRVSSIDSTNVNTSETTLPVPDTVDIWSTSSLAGPFPTEVFSGGAPATSVSPPSASHVSVKLPPCWPRNVELWIAGCEADFEACNITRQETMFNHLQRSLPDE